MFQLRSRVFLEKAPTIAFESAFSSQWHCEGQEFDPPRLRHSKSLELLQKTGLMSRFAGALSRIWYRGGIASGPPVEWCEDLRASGMCVGVPEAGGLFCLTSAKRWRPARRPRRPSPYHRPCSDQQTADRRRQSHFLPRLENTDLCIRREVRSADHGQSRTSHSGGKRNGQFGAARSLFLHSFSFERAT
jgi:hypothetical protein